VPSGPSPRVPPLAALVVAVAAVSTSAVLVRWSDAPAVVKAAYRVLFTVALVAPLARWRSPDAFARLRPRDSLAAVGAGVALAVHFAAWFASLDHTSVPASVTLVQTQPVFVAVAAWAFLDERVTARRAAGVAVAVVGVAAMSFGDAVLGGVPLVGSLAVGGDAAGTTLYGNALALVGAVAAAAYVLAGRSLRQRVPLFPYVTVVYAACAATLFAVAAARGHALLGYPAREWALFAAMALGPGVFGHTVVNWALAHVDSSVVSVSLLGEPVGATLLALVVLAEVPTPLTLLGGSVVLAGAVLTARAQ
jgi:drug/metabolite transporter (DMT)-like permease